ncbi:DUF4136 domain-containing protein [Halopseudomonas salegens]|uniref:DUF4136 domain-containing protein n=1 Tax=Halopseudomonas salegens TaxID=1434072 RepID=A0A1H2HKA8_9GAMM|nr:DUF4136 domain-containing protein [Halopseudomonas salegens]SDU32283.1 protein of unknown function [Halopseudomonas salegens]
MRVFALLAVFALLLGCQSTSTVQRDFNPTHSFQDYQVWDWADPAVEFRPQGDPRIMSDLTANRIREAVSAQLATSGLRPATENAPADLLVRTYLINEPKQDVVTITHGGFFGAYWGGGWAGGPAYSETRAVDYREVTLQVDLLHPQTGELLWRGSDTELLRDKPQSPDQRNQQIQRLVTRILGTFPPG